MPPPSLTGSAQREAAEAAARAHGVVVRSAVRPLRWAWRESLLDCPGATGLQWLDLTPGDVWSRNAVRSFAPLALPFLAHAVPLAVEQGDDPCGRAAA